MKAFKIFSGFITLFVITPIWYYLMYKILVLVNATDLMMFLFWIYLPAGIFASFVVKIAEMSEKK